jgi:catechol 2,3-dioxygenase-like lactoylglutathione lyase family enzyme
MIHALDHIVLAARTPATAASDYERLLGRHAQRGPEGRGASIQLANVRLEFSAATQAEGLTGLAFATNDLGKAQNLLGRRGLPAKRLDAPQSLQIAPAATHGVAISLVARQADAALSTAALQARDDADAAVDRLDHIVVRSPDPERAIALYAGRLGLSLRLDRSEPAWGARLLFLRCGDLIVEIAHDLKAGVGGGPDRLWGLSWHVPDVVKAHGRLRTVGIDVSDIRAGRRPGTQVFTAKSGTAGVPTLMIGSAADKIA